MAEMDSFRTVTALFSQYWQEFKDFRAIEKVAKKYPCANINMTTKMLEDLKIVDIYGNRVRYNIERLVDVVEYMVDDD